MFLYIGNILSFRFVFVILVIIIIVVVKDTFIKFTLGLSSLFLSTNSIIDFLGAKIQHLLFLASFLLFFLLFKFTDVL